MDRNIVATRIWVPILGVAVVATVFAILPSQPENAHDEASAVGALRTINTAQIEYAHASPERKFASSLRELGPDSAGLIDSALASGKKSMYIFTLTALAPDSEGRVNRYSITARPINHRKDKHNFFTDETGVIRFTLEDRSATGADSSLQ